MAYSNFKPTIWSKYIQTELGKHTVFEQDCDFRFKGEVGKGKTVKILGVAPPTIGNYTGANIGNPEAVPDSSVYLVINQAKFFNFMVDDVDEAQATDGLMQALMKESTRAMAEARDTYIAGLCADGAGGASSSATITTAAGAKSAVDAGLIYLWNNGVSQKDDVTAYLSPNVYQLMAEYITETKTDNDKLLAQGILGTYSGMKIKMSNNLKDDGTNRLLIIKTSKAVAFAGGIDEVEAYRPEGFFSDAIKGLNTFGGKVVRPKEMYVIKEKKA
ncbi:MAG: hypothetical protein ACOYI4_03715 [Christensenellales bacterium]|jgi:hypothetical protein